MSKCYQARTKVDEIPIDTGLYACFSSILDATPPRLRNSVFYDCNLIDTNKPVDKQNVELRLEIALERKPDETHKIVVYAHGEDLADANKSAELVRRRWKKDLTAKLPDQE